MPLPISKDKFLKYRFMNNSANLRPFMSETRWMTALTFQQMLAKYKKVIAKPVGGSRGKGVFQVSALGNNLYQVHVENRKYKVRGQQQAFALVQRHVGAGGYMVQRCISRADINGRPFDMRVIVQRKTNSPHWVVTAKVAKVAGSGYIVSNIERSKGTVLLVGTALRRSSLKGRSPHLLQKNLDQVALRSATRLRELFPEHRMYGFDLALDRRGRVWIIEANLFPARSHFRKLADKTMLNRINAYRFG